MDQKLPSEKLAEKPHPWRTALLVLGLVAVAAAAVFISGSVLKPNTGRPDVSVVHLVGAPGKPTTPQISHKLLLTDHVEKSTTPPPPPEPEPSYGGDGGASVNPDGSVSGAGCPPPYINSGGSCHPAICEVLDDGTEIPCAIAARATLVRID